MTNLRQAWRDGRPYFILIMGALAWALVANLGQMVTESRKWRDLTRQTPFSDVTITHISATSVEVTLRGTLIKQRDCQTVGSPMAQVIAAGVVLPATFRAAEAQGTPASRPRGHEPQAWGPWVITSPVQWPDTVRMYRAHRCGDDLQTNQVFSVPWPR